MEIERRTIEITRDGIRLAARLSLPVTGRRPLPCVIFIHGLGSSKESPRNTVVAERLLDARFATLLFDLSGHGESGLDPRGEDAYVDDLVAAYRWAQAQPDLDQDRLGIAGSSLGAVIAVRATRSARIQPATMVLRAPPLRPTDWQTLRVPSLVLVGSEDPLLPGARTGAQRCRAATLAVVPGAGHLFEEPGTLEEAIRRTVAWFVERLVAAQAPARASAAKDDPLFRDRSHAGAQLAAQMQAYRHQHPLVLGIPRGGVPVAAEVARRLDCELDVVVARKLGAPGYSELAIGAVTANGGRFLNEDVIRHLAVSHAYIEQVTEEQSAEARRREERFRGGRKAADVKGRVVIIVDDGLATGATMRAAVRSVRQWEPARVIVAVPDRSERRIRRA